MGDGQDSEVKVERSVCPRCFEGQIFQQNDQKFHDCPLCCGNGWIVTNHICACGRPVTTADKDNIIFCGREACQKALVISRNIDKHQYTGFNRHY